ncbi:MAG: hypothetical protein HGB11_12215 [Chlorobiales bacterium]|nr:hypothetical protein [Chlorobiales bacterium]
MTCEIYEYCTFFDNSMVNMPVSSDYIKDKLCFGEFELCARFRVHKELGEGIDISAELLSYDTVEFRQFSQCIRRKQQNMIRENIQNLLIEFLK